MAITVFARFCIVKGQTETETFKIEPLCKKEGIWFGGKTTKQLKSESFDDCAKACKEEDWCKSLSFGHIRKDCFLFNVKGGRGPQSSGDHNPYTSLVMDCDTSPVDSSCRRDNYNYMNADLPLSDVFPLKADGFDDCARHCRDTELCKAFTLSKSDNTCILKTKRGGHRGGRPYDGYISMNIDCSVKVDVSDRSCDMDGYNMRWADLRHFTSTGYEQCAIACGDSEECKAFSLRKSDNYCWLKYMYGGSRGPGRVNNYISRNMECDTSDLDLSCARDGIDLPGGRLQYGFKTTSFEECAKICRMSEKCIAISFRKADKECYLKRDNTYNTGIGEPTPDAAMISMIFDCSETEPES